MVDRLNDLKAFDLIRRAAREYNEAEYSFYTSGFFKHIKKGDFMFIDDIYIIPEHRGTPVASIMLENFNNKMKEQGILGYYGNVYKGNEKSLEKLKSWGMTVIEENELYTTVFKRT